MFQALEKIIASAAIGDKSRHFSCYISQLRTFRTVVWTSEENKSEGGVTNSIILWIFVRVEKSLSVGPMFSSGLRKSSGRSATADLFYNQPPQTVSDEDDFRRRCCLSRIIRIATNPGDGLFGYL